MTVEEACYILERCWSAVRGHPVHFLIDCTDLHNLVPGVLAIVAGYSEFFTAFQHTLVGLCDAQRPSQAAHSNAVCTGSLMTAIPPMKFCIR
jgi:hypothetical protein